MNSAQDVDRRIRETIAPHELALQAPVAKQPQAVAETPVASQSDARSLTSAAAGKSRSTVAFVATSGETSITRYGLQDVAGLVGAMDGLQHPGTDRKAPATADSVSLILTVGVPADELISGLQDGSIGRIATETLRDGVILAQTGDYQKIHAAAVRKGETAASLFTEVADQLLPTEKPYFERTQEGMEVQETVADETLEKADNQRTGDVIPDEIVIIEEPAPAPAPAPLPRRPLTLPRGISREIVDTIAQGMAPQTATPAQRSAPCSRRLKLGDTRRERIMNLAADFMGSDYSSGDRAKLQRFQAAVALAADKGLRVDDAKYRDVTAYLQKLVAGNPRLGKMIEIRNGVIRIDAPPNLFSDFSKVSSLVGLSLILTSNDKAMQLAMRDMLLAASSPAGVDLNDPKLGKLARQALALARQNGAIFDKDLFQEKDGRLFIALDGKERQDLTDYYAYFSTDKHSAAAKRLEAAQNEAITAMNASITASAAALVTMTLLEALGAAGLAPVPTGQPVGLDPSLATAATGKPHQQEPGAKPADPIPPRPAPADREAGTRTVLPPTQAAPSQDTNRIDYLTDIRRADSALAETRAERLRAEARRNADIRADVEQSGRDYLAALDKQSQVKTDMAHQAETAGVARIQRLDGRRIAVAVDRQSRVKTGDVPVTE